MASFLSLSFGVVNGEYMSHSSREDLNNKRSNSPDANSAIISPIETTTWYGEVTGITYGFISVNLPINGLKHYLKPLIIVFVIWQLILFAILFKNYQFCLRNKKIYQKELLLLTFLFSYFIIQGIFEPDLGSAIKHKIGILPLIYYAIYFKELKLKNH